MKSSKLTRDLFRTWRNVNHYTYQMLEGLFRSCRLDQLLGDHRRNHARNHARKKKRKRKQNEQCVRSKSFRNYLHVWHGFRQALRVTFVVFGQDIGSLTDPYTVFKFSNHQCDRHRNISLQQQLSAMQTNNEDDRIESICKER